MTECYTKEEQMHSAHNKCTSCKGNIKVLGEPESLEGRVGGVESGVRRRESRTSKARYILIRGGLPSLLAPSCSLN